MTFDASGVRQYAPYLGEGAVSATDALG
jgi:hypothetical protein